MKGFFVGISLEASGIFSRPDVNRIFYGQDVNPSKLLSGEYPKPIGAGPLYRALEEVFEAAASKGSIASSSSQRLRGSMAGAKSFESGQAGCSEYGITR